MIPISGIFPVGQSLAGLTLLNLLEIIIGLIILWVIVSIPVYIAGKALTGGKSTIGDAMLATLFGPIVYIIVLAIVSFFLGTVIGGTALIFAYILALIGWIWVFKASFGVGWLRGLGIAILAIIMFVVINAILAALFGIAQPQFFYPHI